MSIVTQIIRLMFRFESSFLKDSQSRSCQDVLRSIIAWAMQKQGLFDDENLWDKPWQDKFLAEHSSQPPDKKRFTEDFYAPTVKEVCKWIDDCALFVFGYLVKIFADNVLAEKLYEKVIWTISLFNMTVNVTERVEKPPST